MEIAQKCPRLTDLALMPSSSSSPLSGKWITAFMNRKQPLRSLAIPLTCLEDESVRSELVSILASTSLRVLKEEGPSSLQRQDRIRQIFKDRLNYSRLTFEE